MLTASRLHICSGDQRGATALETAIILIAFVVVASVFAVAMLTTGVLSTEKAEESVLEGVADTSATLVLRGPVIAVATTTKASVSTVKFQVTTASSGDAAVDLSSDSTIVSYVDSEQSRTLSYVSSPSTTPGWGTNWIIGTEPILHPGDRVEFVVNLNGLTPLLAARTEFLIQIKPGRGAVLPVSRTTPVELTGISDLR